MKQVKTSVISVVFIYTSIFTLAQDSTAIPKKWFNKNSIGIEGIEMPRIYNKYYVTLSHIDLIYFRNFILNKYCIIRGGVSLINKNYVYQSKMSIPIYDTVYSKIKIINTNSNILTNAYGLGASFGILILKMIYKKYLYIEPKISIKVPIVWRNNIKIERDTIIIMANTYSIGTSYSSMTEWRKNNLQSSSLESYLQPSINLGLISNIKKFQIQYGFNLCYYPKRNYYNFLYNQEWTVRLNFNIWI